MKVFEESLSQSPVVSEEPVEVKTPVDESPSSPVNIDTFKERTLQKGSEVYSFNIPMKNTSFSTKFLFDRVEQHHLNVWKLLLK